MASISLDFNLFSSYKMTGSDGFVLIAAILAGMILSYCLNMASTIFFFGSMLLLLESEMSSTTQS